MSPTGGRTPLHRFQHLLVGLSRTEADPGLMRYVSQVARLGTTAEVRFVHVLPSSAEIEHDRVLEELQREVRAQGTEIPAGVQVSCEVLHGPLLDQLLVYAAEQESDLLFLGHRQSHPNRWALARRLAMKAPCSVWMVPEGSRAALKRILVPIDFSEHAADSMRVAASMARLRGDAECLALHVYFNEAPATYEGYDQVLRGQETEAYRQFIAPINCQDARVTPVFEEGANIAHVIVRVAQEQDADLIVMATRGRSRSAAILLGSVTEDTIIDTPIPLLVVKHFGARMGVLQALLDRSFRQRKSPRFD